MLEPSVIPSCTKSYEWEKMQCYCDKMYENVDFLCQKVVITENFV